MKRESLRESSHAPPEYESPANSASATATPFFAFAINTIAQKPYQRIHHHAMNSTRMHTPRGHLFDAMATIFSGWIAFNHGVAAVFSLA